MADELLSKEMTAKWKTEEFRLANIPWSNRLKANHSSNKRYSTMTYNVVAHPTKRSAKAKLINKKWGRLRNVFLRSVAMVRVFPTMIRKAITPKQVVRKGLHLLIYNYPPKGRWIVVDIYRDAKRRGIYPPLFTDPEGGSCFTIYQIRWIKNASSISFLKLSWNDAPFLSPFAKQWISKDIPNYRSQSKRAKIAIHWFVDTKACYPADQMPKARLKMLILNSVREWKYHDIAS